MSADRPLFEKVIRRAVLPAGAILLPFGVGCASAEPTRAQAPTPPQGVTTEVVPPGSIPESLPVEEIQIEECGPKAFRATLGVGEIRYTLDPYTLQFEVERRTGPGPDAPVIDTWEAESTLLTECFEILRINGKPAIYALSRDTNGIKRGWKEANPSREVVSRVESRPSSPEKPLLTPFEVYSGLLGQNAAMIMVGLPENWVYLGWFAKEVPCLDGQRRIRTLESAFVLNPDGKYSSLGSADFALPAWSFEVSRTPAGRLSGILNIENSPIDVGGVVCRGGGANFELQPSRDIGLEYAKAAAVAGITYSPEQGLKRVEDKGKFAVPE